MAVVVVVVVVVVAVMVARETTIHPEPSDGSELRDIPEIAPWVARLSPLRTDLVCGLLSGVVVISPNCLACLLSSRYFAPDAGTSGGYELSSCRSLVHYFAPRFGYLSSSHVGSRWRVGRKLCTASRHCLPRR